MSQSAREGVCVDCGYAVWCTK